MTYSDALFFIGKCLSLKSVPDNTDDVRQTIRSGAVDWEQIVWVSTGQFVFSALYLQLRRAGLLSELPSDLVEYMKEFADLNRERNRKMISQVVEITKLLNENGITPVFLKGTAHLLDELYEDIAERQVGDIDILVEESEMVRVAEILIDSGYTPMSEYDPRYFKTTKHYPRLQNYNQVAAVEIHRQILGYPAYKSIDAKTLMENRKILDLPVTAFVLCDQHQIIHNILHVQISHDDFYYARINIRQSYDLYLLSLRVNPLDVVKSFGKYFNQMNCNLAITNKILHNPVTLNYASNLQTNLYIDRISRHINHPKWNSFSHGILFLLVRFSRYTLTLIRITYDKKSRDFLFSLLSDPDWVRQHIKSYKEIF